MAALAYDSAKDRDCVPWARINEYVESCIPLCGTIKFQNANLQDLGYLAGTHIRRRGGNCWTSWEASLPVVSWFEQRRNPLGRQPLLPVPVVLELAGDPNA